MASVEAEVLAETTKKSGDVVESLFNASEKERIKNRDLMKQLISSLYFLIKHHIGHNI